MKSVLTTWILLFGLLLQSVAWAFPVQRAEQAERLSHEVAHAMDHGHHQHDGLGHEVDAALLLDDALDDGQHGPHHSHAADGVQAQGLPVADALSRVAPPAGALPAWGEVQPPSADPDGLLRPPRTTA